MEVKDRVIVAQAEGIARGLLVQLEAGVRLTPVGIEYAEKIWRTFSDLDKLLLTGYLKKATPEST